MLVVLFVWIVSLVVSACDRDGQDDQDLNAWISPTGIDVNNDICSENSPCKTILKVGECFGQNTSVNVFPGTYDIVIVANLSQLEGKTGLPYFRFFGTSQNDTFMTVKGSDYKQLHIVAEFKNSYQILYCYKAIFSMENMTVDVRELPPANDKSSLVWMHDNSSEASFVNVDFKGNFFPEYLFILTGGNLTLKSVRISPPNNLLAGNIALWYGSYGSVVHKGSWTIDGVEIKNTNYTNSNSLFEQAYSGTLDVSILNSVFENITWDLFGEFSFRRLVNAGEIGLVYTAPSMNSGTVKIANSTFRALDCSSRVPLNVQTAPLVIFSSALTGTPLILPNLIFEDCSGTAGGTLVTQVNVNLEGYYATGNKRGSDKNDEVIPIGNVAINYDESSCTGNRDDTHRNCGEADPKEFPTWALVIIIVIAVVVVAAVIVVIVVAVYFRKKKYQALTDDEEFSESSSSLRSSDKENELDSI